MEEFWLNPPLQSRLDGGGNGEALLFARRMPASVSVFSDGKAVGSALPYEFSVEEGGCGELSVRAGFAPIGDNMEMNKSAGPLFPFQLVEENASYLPFYVRFGWNETRGRKKVEIAYEDWFSHAFNFTREFSVRNPESFSPGGYGGEMTFRQADDRTAAAAYPSGAAGGAPVDFAAFAAGFALLSLSRT